MAEIPTPELIFSGQCPDCGERCAPLPVPLPVVEDDFNWRLRDYDDFRSFLREELAVRFPERRRWAVVDLEVVLIEAFAAILDQLSDMADRVASEAVLETARRPESVRRLLQLIGHPIDSGGTEEFQQWVEEKRKHWDEHPPEVKTKEIENYWLRHPPEMETARKEGPRAIRTQRRMVTLDDYAARIEEHPAVLRAHSWFRWSGSWNTVNIAVIVWDGKKWIQLDQTEKVAFTPTLLKDMVAFHRLHKLPEPWSAGTEPSAQGVTLRSILRPYLRKYRMAGQEVILRDTEPVPVSLAFSIQVAPNYYQAEVRRAVEQALGIGPQGFFRPGRLRFGEDLHSSDLLETLVALDGVENVCLNRFKRLGSRFPDERQAGQIVLEDIEIAVCDNDARSPDRGYYRLTLNGGLKG